MKDPALLIQAQDAVWANPKLREDKYPDGLPRTHCNQAAAAVANAMGCHEFDGPVKGFPACDNGGDFYTADQLFYFFQRVNSNFFEKDMGDCHDLVQKGSLIFAVVPSWLLKESHGHIVSLTPGDQVKSESLQMWVPVCLNISTTVLSSRSVGINFAFPMKRVKPRFFAWKGSL